LEQQPLWDEFLAFKLSTVVHLDPSVAISSSDSQKLRMLEADACVDQWTMDNPVWPPPFPDESIACPAAAAAIVSATPETVPKNAAAGGGVRMSRGRGAAVNAAIQSDGLSTPIGKEYLANRDLFGLEPALSVRTRIMLASLSLLQMSPLDIAKSFEIAGYFPRKRSKCQKFAACLYLFHITPCTQTAKAATIS
jgi:hypothetical protein